jgi:hypothetical protein
VNAESAENIAGSIKERRPPRILCNTWASVFCAYLRTLFQQIFADDEGYKFRPIGTSTELRSGLYAVETDISGMAYLISRVLAGGGIVQSVQPKASLETVFFRTIASAQENGK